MLGRNPDLRLIAASHTHELAVAMNRDVQRIMDNRGVHDEDGGRAQGGADPPPDAVHLPPRVPLPRRLARPGTRAAGRRLVDQLMDFPLAEHDNGPDALEMCVRLPVELKRVR